MQVVWFKRDLRVSDHAPLTQAAKSGRCLCLYVYEPELIHSDEFDSSHLEFINESLRGEHYSKEMSSPVTAGNSCSRLSPYLAWGCLSLKRISHAVRDRRAELKQNPVQGRLPNWERLSKADCGARGGVP